MKRFIHHEELARDSRFVRQDNAQSTVLASLPDDVDTIQGVLEVMSMQGEMIAELEPGERIDKSEFDYPFMPPFVGTEEEKEALAQFLGNLATGDRDMAQKGGAR